jgi:hypothetical protein
MLNIFYQKKLMLNILIFVTYIHVEKQFYVAQGDRWTITNAQYKYPH